MVPSPLSSATTKRCVAPIVLGAPAASEGDGVPRGLPEGWIETALGLVVSLAGAIPAGGFRSS